MLYDLKDVPRPSAQEMIEANSHLIRAIMRSAPQPIKETWKQINQASSQENFEDLRQQLEAQCQDWSRINTDRRLRHDGCRCVLCNIRLTSQRDVSNHFAGYIGNCDVWSSMMLTARLKYSLTEARAQEREAAQKAEAIRKGTVYKIDLFKPPSTKSGIIYLERNSEQEAFAESRLKELGFVQSKKKVCQNVTEIRWERTIDDTYILADPLRPGTITFRAWPMSVKKHPNFVRRKFYNPGEEIQDRWHKDLEQKLMTRVKKQLSLWEIY